MDNRQDQSPIYWKMSAFWTEMHTSWWGKGVDGENINPVIHAKIISTHMTPRYLYGLEVINLKKAKTILIKGCYMCRTLLMNIQPLLLWTEAIHLLLGLLDGAIIHCRVMCICVGWTQSHHWNAWCRDKSRLRTIPPTGSSILEGLSPCIT